MTRIAAIIPVGTLEGAKTRLGDRLDAEERQDLVAGLLARTVVAALAVKRLDDVLVVSPDPEVLRRAADLGARTIRQRSRGLNAGLREARTDVVAGGAEAILVLPIDLPFVTPERIASLLEPLERSSETAADAPTRFPATPIASEAPTTASEAPTVVLVTDRHGTGTNALGLRPPDAIDFAFGRASRTNHRTAAETAGATLIELDGPLTVDLDTPDDFVFVETAEAAEAARAAEPAQTADPERLGVH